MFCCMNCITREELFSRKHIYCILEVFYQCKKSTELLKPVFENSLLLKRKINLQSYSEIVERPGRILVAKGVSQTKSDVCRKGSLIEEEEWPTS